MIVGTAGHIDHGKTSLVRALTGVDPDRLKEEKARGITIDLGFAYLPVDGGPTLGFVDVPGHERFVHTMVAGASGIDFALLVVAADDGVMPQTLEHLAIVDLFGTQRGLVALTKADLVPPERLAAVANDIREACRGTVLAGADIVPVSSATGAGIDALRARLIAEAEILGERREDGRFRMAADRVFTLPGIGVVVTGTVLSGSVRLKDPVTISPPGIAARVRSIHAQNRQVDIGRAGDRCALNLAGDGVAKDAIQRGDMIVDPALHAPADRIDARMTLLPSESKAIAAWFPARLHHGSAEVGVRVVPLEGEQLRPGQAADVQLVLDRPIAAAAFDRFVLRDVSARRTIGGGHFIDLRAPERQRRKPERVAERAALSHHDPRTAFAALLDTPPYARDIDAFARDRALSAEARDALLPPMAHMFVTGDERIVLGDAAWRHFVTAVVERLVAFHAAHPDLPGLAREKLRVSVVPRLPAAALAMALQHDDLVGAVVRDGAFVRLVSHSVQMGAARESLWAAIEPLLGGPARFRPPRVRDIAGELRRPEDEVRQLLRFVGRLGSVVEVAHDHYFLRATMHEMVGIALDVSAEAQDGFFGVAAFRDRLDCGRKVAIQILEFFERQGVMLKRGTSRRVQARYADLYAPASP